MIWFMTTVHVRANQTTVDWAEGAEFVCERTPFVDNLIKHGGLTELDAVPDEYTDTSQFESVDINRARAELELDEAQKKAIAAQEDLNEARADATDTITELNTELDTDQSRKSEIGAGIEDSVVSAEMEKRGDDGDDDSVGRASGPELDNESDAPKAPRTRRRTS